MYPTVSSISSSKFVLCIFEITSFCPIVKTYFFISDYKISILKEKLIGLTFTFFYYNTNININILLIAI